MSAKAASCPVGSPGRGGYALSFDGDDEVRIPHAAHLSFGADSSFTIELWVRHDGSRSIYHILGKRVSCSYDYLNYQIARDGASLLLFASGRSAVGSGYDPAADTWTHVAVTYANSTLTMYVNGEPRVSTPFTISGEASEPLLFGDSGGCPTYQRLRGEIDEVRIWRVARAAQEIASFYKRKVDPRTPGLVGYWDFDEPEGQVVRDGSPYGNNGLLGSDANPAGDDPQRIESTAPIASWYTFPRPFPARRYFLFSLPVDFDEGTHLSQLLSDLGPPGVHTWRGFGLDEGQLIEDPAFARGQGCWLALAGVPRTVTVEGYPLPDAWEVPLTPGWNLVGLPAPPEDWPAIRILQGSQSWAFGDTTRACPVDPWALWYRDDTGDLTNNGRWDPVAPGYMTGAGNPWSGYCLWSKSTVTIVVKSARESFDVGAKTATLRAAGVMRPEWSLDLSVSSGNSSDLGVCVGVRDGARTGWDRADVRKPPLPQAGVELCIVQTIDLGRGSASETKDTGQLGPGGLVGLGADRFLRVFDAPGSDAYEWHLRVGGEESLATLSVAGVAQLPMGWHVSLHDPAGGMAVDLRRTASHTFALGGRRDFVIRVGAHAPEGWTWSPAQTGLTGLAPNPTSGPIALRYTQADAGRVRIELFDVQGRRISCLDEGIRDAGRYSLVWNPVDRELGAGVYVIRLQAGAIVDHRKLVVIR